MARWAHRLLCVSVVFIAACDENLDLTKRPLYDNGFYALQGAVVDALTGQAVPNATVTLDVGLDSLPAKVTGNQYVIKNIPPGTFPIEAAAPGYLPFRGNSAAFAALPGGTSISGGSRLVYTYSTGNIAMMPEGTA